MSKGYESPTAALAAIVECLDAVCSRIHVGSLGSGETLPCCPGCLLRVETAGIRVQDGRARSVVNMQRCNALILDVVINYRECFKTMNDRGKSFSVETMTAAGTALVNSWWAALQKLVCCSPLNQNLRFIGVQDVSADGVCAGWTMTVEVDVSMCEPCA